MPPRQTQRPQTEAPRWLLTDASTLRWAQWETETSLFNGDTGETHLLSEFPVFILTTLSHGTATLGALSEATAQACAVENTAAWQAKVRTVLDDLADLELIQQLDS